jgi:hypothetical protein
MCSLFSWRHTIFHLFQTDIILDTFFDNDSQQNSSFVLVVICNKTVHLSELRMSFDQKGHSAKMVVWSKQFSYHLVSLSLSLSESYDKFCRYSYFNPRNFSIGFSICPRPIWSYLSRSAVWYTSSTKPLYMNFSTALSGLLYTIKHVLVLVYQNAKILSTACTLLWGIAS